MIVYSDTSWLLSYFSNLNRHSPKPWEKRGVETEILEFKLKQNFGNSAKQRKQRPVQVWDSLTIS